MPRQNIVYIAGRKLFFDFIADVIYFPVWWYTVGYKHFLTVRIQEIGEMAKNLSLRLLVLNISKPMFAQYDRAGRIISFFMRLVILAARSIFFILYAALQVVLMCLWVLVPAVIVYRLFDIFILSYVR